MFLWVKTLVLLLAFFTDLCLSQTTQFGHLPHNFTLAALNTTLPNANTTGAPLVLGQNGASSGITFYVTSTYASFPYNDYPALGLVDNGLRAYSSTGRWITNATAVTSGGTLGWISTTIYAHPAPQIYSVVRLPGYEYPLLAANGFHNLWSLCPFSGNRPQTNIVFNVTADVPPPPYLGFDPSLCYDVVITMIPIEDHEDHEGW
ncbi:hypothetical protein JR316_0011691 [Psilocybe cubensis]|uniref:Uncharacterized protein n=2 Tax=Psilocybe cubensis TaxID=181762 RepID=A0ACB8GM70_PSICU|nr:hypothetical protein JR316_0011691 [Psilocybe cubensis]KAH9476120.1 hypothetical protein JR316_0011691 [Psilocybe cubensis]